MAEYLLVGNLDSFGAVYTWDSWKDEGAISGWNATVHEW